jgi:hypothetical protein
VSSAGFQKFVQENIEVQVSTTDRVDVTHQVGAASETVTIPAEAAQFKPESAEQSTVVATSEIIRLPLNFGEFFRRRMDMVHHQGGGRRS